jgi:hypothetical protein
MPKIIKAILANLVIWVAKKLNYDPAEFKKMVDNA